MISFLLVPLLFLSFAMNTVTAMLMAISTVFSLGASLFIGALVTYSLGFLTFMIILFS
jgi:hypothetical protein